MVPSSFYDRPTLEVAPALLGKIVAVRSREGMCGGRIVETEAYRQDDPASHSFRGRTPRASVMFGDPGRAYVYFIYGMYEMLNFVTEAPGVAGAVLIRALEPVLGTELMRKRRGLAAKASSAALLTAGPGRLCRSLGISKRHNAESLQGPVLWVLDDGFRPASISVSPRVGIRVGTEAPWRFFVSGNPCVSRAPQNRHAAPLAEGLR